jgi:hypothetical protein
MMKRSSWTLSVLMTGIALAALGADASAGQQLKKFFLTIGEFTGSQATTACPKGFHMASLWEILERFMGLDSDRRVPHLP